MCYMVTLYQIISELLIGRMSRTDNPPGWWWEGGEKDT